MLHLREAPSKGHETATCYLSHTGTMEGGLSQNICTPAPLDFIFKARPHQNDCYSKSGVHIDRKTSSQGAGRTGRESARPPAASVPAPHFDPRVRCDCRLFVRKPPGSAARSQLSHVLMTPESDRHLLHGPHRAAESRRDDSRNTHIKSCSPVMFLS